jgi:hypothetical protein
MDRVPQISDGPSRLADVNSLLFSGVVHFGALIGLGLLTAASQENWRGVKLMVNVGDGSELPKLDDSPLENVVELQVEPDPAGAMGPVQLFADIAMPTTDLAALDAISERDAEVSGLEGLALGGTSEEDGSTGLASTEFFGIGGYGQSFVYVVDCSGSMNERGKFDRARHQLMQSIGQLAGDQRYFVIFFNDGPHPMEADELVPATEAQVAGTARWVSYVEARGGTNPLPALLYAISLRPDAVYFLSDGRFDPVTISHLRIRNRPNRRLGTKEIPIHTIAFVDRATERLMRTIARNSGGEFRFVK